MQRLTIALLFAGLAYAMSPFSAKPSTVMVPGEVQLDAMQSTLLTADGVDRLLTAPLSYYDTAILYPDHNQRRSLEPFLAPAIIGVPLRIALRLDDTRGFETIRWLLAFTALVYGFLLLRALGVDTLLSVAGAAVCVAQPMVLHGNERLQFPSVPLLLPVIYHGLMLWVGAPRARHTAGFVVCAVLYPLFSLVNATAAALAVLLVTPLLLRMLVLARRDGRLLTMLTPVVLSGACVAILIAPWWLDRVDMDPYVSPAFLAIKHWNAFDLPGDGAQARDFLSRHVGWGVLSMVACWAGARSLGPRTARLIPPAWFIWPAPIIAVVIAVWTVRADAPVAAGLALAFQTACYGALVWFWWMQWRVSLSGTDAALRVALTLGVGTGVLLCLVSFGPQVASNPSPLATDLVRRLLSVIAPLSAVREFYRIWMSGLLLFSLFVVIRLSLALRSRPAYARGVVAATLGLALIVSLSERSLSASDEIVAQAEVTTLAAHSLSRGAIYVQMRWDAKSCVLMMATARDLRRPTVNGCLGLIPPWFPYATRVLHRFPDAEALWLLRHWRVETVINLDTGTRIDPPALTSRILAGPDGSVFEIQPPEGPSPHPSAPSAGDRVGERVTAEWTVDPANPSVLTVRGPAGGAWSAMEFQFALAGTVIDTIPSEIRVSSSDDAARVPLNTGDSGRWIESLAADALVRRQSPVVRVGLAPFPAGPLRVEWIGTPKAPIERIVMVRDRQ